MLEALNIGVTLGGRNILHDVHFSARPGELTVIAGPNGSGKSTLLKAMTGEIACSGHITLNGHDIRTTKPWKLAAQRGVLPQHTPLAFPFTVAEVVRMGLRRSTELSGAALIPQALARVGLPGYDGRLYQDLSGGEQQRTQLARVLAQVWTPKDDDGPRWLFLDEPVSSLDIAHQLQVMQIARDYADAGGGVVAVMHDLNLTALYADQMTLISKGRVHATGTPAQVMQDGILSSAYDCALRVNAAPTGATFLLPHAALGLAAE